MSVDCVSYVILFVFLLLYYSVDFTFFLHIMLFTIFCINIVSWLLYVYSFYYCLCCVIVFLFLLILIVDCVAVWLLLIYYLLFNIID